MCHSHTGMEMSPERDGWIRSVPEHCDYVRVTLVDMNGVPRVKIVPAHVLKDFADEGVGMYAGTVGLSLDGHIEMYKEVVERGLGDIFARPIGSTFKVLAWAQKGSSRVGQVLCDPYYKDGSIQKAAPRVIARQQVEQLAKRGYRLWSASELEFRLLHGNTPVHDENQIFNSHVSARYEQILFEIERQVKSAGVQVQTLQSEYGRGQFELTLRPEFGLDSADAAFNFRMAVKEIAAKCPGMEASFMTKLDTNDVGNSQHFNHSLWITGMSGGLVNAFADPCSAAGFSVEALHWLGGICKHAKALTALCAPTKNCYRRLHAPWAPSKAFWGVEDRRALIRAKNSSEKATYLELRLPGGSANAHIVMAGVIAAGIDGLDNKLTPVGVDEAESAEIIPKTLEDALKALEADSVIVDALGTEFVDWFTRLKRYEIGKLVPAEDESAEKAIYNEGQLYRCL